MTIVTRNKSKIDNKECFLLWVELGSLKNVSLEYARRGVLYTPYKEPFTPKPFSVSTISRRALMWVVEYPDEARPYYIKEGSRLTDEQWERWLIEKAMSIYKQSPRTFFLWIEKNEFQKYEHVYIQRYGTLEHFREMPYTKGRHKY